MICSSCGIKILESAWFLWRSQQVDVARTLHSPAVWHERKLASWPPASSRKCPRLARRFAPQTEKGTTAVTAMADLGASWHESERRKLRRTAACGSRLARSKGICERGSVD